MTHHVTARGVALAGLLLALFAWRSTLPTLLAQPGSGIPLRQGNWDDTLRNDPHVRVSMDCIAGPASPAGLGLCITVPLDQPQVVAGSGDAGSMAFTGYAATAPGDVLYGDLDGDGLE